MTKPKHTRRADSAPHSTHLSWNLLSFANQFLGTDMRTSVFIHINNTVMKVTWRVYAQETKEFMLYLVDYADDPM